MEINSRPAFRCFLTCLSSPLNRVGTVLKNKKYFKIACISFLGTIIMGSMLTIFLLSMNIMPSNTIISGVTVLNSDLSGLTVREAEDKLLLLEKEAIDNKALTLRYGDRSWQLQPQMIGVAMDRGKILEEAIKTGKQGSVIQRWNQWRQAREEGIKIPAHIYIDRTVLDSQLKIVTSEITKQPEDAKLKINPDETVSVVPSRDGIIVDSEKTYREIKKSLERNDMPAEAELSIITVSPEKATQEVIDMGVNVLLSSYTTTFDANDIDRSYNIRVAASALDELLIPPGREFSFNEVVGPRSSEAGYKNAKIIVNQEFVDGLGGGVCQLSSTLYNSVMLADIKILDRTNHSIPVSYVPPGRDATVAYGYIDFRFKNTTPYYLYIKTIFNPSRITVKIYGNKNSRKQVYVKTKVIETFPFKEVYKEDPALKKGEILIIKKGSPGLRVTAEKTVIHNNIAQTETLPNSLYHPVDQMIIIAPELKE